MPRVNKSLGTVKLLMPRGDDALSAYRGPKPKETDEHRLLAGDLLKGCVIAKSRVDVALESRIPGG